MIGKKNQQNEPKQKENINLLKDEKLQLILQENEHSQPKDKELKSRKIKTESNSSKKAQRPKQFITSTIEKRVNHEEEQKKRIRVKSYFERLISMSPDETTLERIRQVKQQMMITQQLSKQKLSKQFNKRKRVFSLKNLSTQKYQNLQYSIIKKQQRIQLINQSKPKRVKTQTFINKNQNIEKNKNLKLRKPNNGQLDDQGSSILPKISRKSQSKSQNRIENNRQYKNYLLDLKLKPLQPISEYEKEKKKLKYPVQILKEFSKKSSKIQQKIMAKIKEFQQLQKNQNYQQSLVKEKQMDQLFSKSLQIKLACLMEN